MPAVALTLQCGTAWIPACAGMTMQVGKRFVLRDIVMFFLDGVAVV
jgi:hypothetical protein